MSVQNSVSRTAVRLLLLAAAPVLFAACTADQGPSPMPTGYKYLNRQYVVPSTGPVETKVYPGEYPAPQAAPPMGLQPSPGEMATVMAPPPVTAAPIMAPAPMMAAMTTTAASTTTTTTTTTATTTPAADTPAVMAVSPQWKGAAADLLTKTEHDFGRLQDPVYVRDAVAGQAGEPAFRQALNEVLAERHYKISADKKMAPFAFDYNVGAPAPTGKTALSLTVLSQAKPIITEKGDYDLNPGASVMQAPVASPAVSPPVSPPVSPVASMTPAAAPSPAVSTPAPTPAAALASNMTVSATPAAPAPVTAPVTAPLTAAGAQKPVIVTGPGSAPPPPLPAMAAVSTPVPDDAASSAPASAPASATPPTYVYDGRSTNAPGRTAYEQRQGVNREIDMASPDDGTDR